MSTTTAPATSEKPKRVRASRAKKDTTQSVEAPAAPPVVSTPAPAAPVERPSLLSTIDLNAEFGIDGSVTRRDTFKYNLVKGGSYVIRHAIFQRLASATAEEIKGLTINQRKAAFALIKKERQRYYGEATRAIDSATAKAGEPLPRLSFESKIAAVSYGNAVRAAGNNLRMIVFPASVPAAVVDPASVAPVQA